MFLNKIKSIIEFKSMLQNVIECYRMLQNVIECYRMLQNVIELLQNVIECYRIVIESRIISMKYFLIKLKYNRTQVLLVVYFQ